MNHTLTRPPMPRAYPLVGNVPLLDPDHVVQSLMKLADELGPIYRFKFPNRTVHVISSVALVDEVCDGTRFDKQLHGPLRNIRDFAGDGLFTAHTEEPNWAKGHRVLTPAFGPAALRSYYDRMVDIAEQMFDKWERLGPAAEIDVVSDMTRLTLDTIALCGFDYRFNSFYTDDMHPFVEAMVGALAEAAKRSRELGLQTRLRRKDAAAYTAHIAHMNEVVDTVIQERREHDPDGTIDDLLGRMLHSVDPVTGETLDDLNIRYQIVTFLIAGHETTSGLLSFATWHLLNHPEVLDKARAEVDRVLGDRLPTHADLRELVYIDMILRESLRVWPTAPAFALKSKEDVVLGGQYPLEAGAEVFVLTPSLHRDPSVWERPRSFHPEHFAPERRAGIPVNAWKPFGHGQRACIGRQFAMQEATLVLARLLQRFELVDGFDIPLKVKETLTLKPDGLTLRVQPRRAVASTPRQVEAADTEAPTVAEPTLAHHGQTLRVGYGSNSGTAEGVARQVAAEAERTGYDVWCGPLDALVPTLTDGAPLVVVTASYNGLPPDNAAVFCDALDALPDGAFAGVPFAVLGLGHRDWRATFQAVPTRVHQALARLGGVALLERGAADGAGDVAADVDGWLERFWPVAHEHFGVEVADGPVAASLELAWVPADPLAEAFELREATVVSVTELVDMSSPWGRSKAEVVLELPVGMSYAPGDHLAVLAPNPPSRVERLITRLGLDPRQALRREAPSSLLPAWAPGQVLTVETLLSRWVDLGQPVSRKALAAVVASTGCPPEQRQLAALLEDGTFEAEVLARRVTLLDLLERAASCTLGLTGILALLPPMQPRRYSISSSPRRDPRRCTLTVARVEGPSWAGQGTYEGVASTALHRAQPGERLPVGVRAPHGDFSLPVDPATPIVMIAAGTGLAPFLGFLEEREALQAAGQVLGPAQLFLGCDHPDVDLLHAERLAAWQAAGVCTLHTAFFRQPDGPVHFVQHRVAAEAEQVAERIAAGGVLYVCGDGRRMAPAVAQAVQDLWAAREGLSDEAAAAWWQAGLASGRIKVDVFG